MALNEKAFSPETIKGLALAELQAAVEALQVVPAGFSTIFAGDTSHSPGPGGSQPPSAFKGHYMGWGFSLTNPDNGMTFVLPQNATALRLSAYPKVNTMPTSLGKLQVFRTVGSALMASAGVLVPGSELTWGPGDTSEKRLDLTGLSLDRGDSITVFYGVTNDGGGGTFENVSGGMIFF